MKRLKGILCSLALLGGCGVSVPDSRGYQKAETPPSSAATIKETSKESNNSTVAIPKWQHRA